MKKYILLVSHEILERDWRHTNLFLNKFGLKLWNVIGIIQCIATTTNREEETLQVTQKQLIPKQWPRAQNWEHCHFELQFCDSVP